jgi:PAS domain S-box-containing protein
MNSWPSHQKPDIVIVDDAIENLIYLSDVLTNRGYCVATADGGEEALECIFANPPLLILLDIMMPVMDGFSVCLQLKANEVTSQIPVIFITALDDIESKLTGFHLGGVDYITKPFHKEEVFARVEAHIKLFKMQHKLKESEEKYRYLFDSNPAPMWIYDLETLSFLEVNEAAIVHYGYSREEFLGMSLLEIRPEDDINRLLTDVTLTNNKLNKAGTWKHKLKNGQVIFVDIVSHEVDFNGKKARLVISTDISERVKTQLEIENERQMLRTLIDNLPDAIYVKDKECRKIIANRFDLENIGIDDENEVLGKTDLELFDHEIGQRGYLDDVNVITSGKPIINQEERFIDKKGNIRWLQTSKFPLFDNNGNITGLVGIGLDITEQKLANEAVLQERKLLRTLIDHLPDAIYVKDKDARKLVANLADLKIMGYESETEVIGKTDLEIFKSHYEQGGYYEDIDVIKSGKPLLNKQDSYVDKNGGLHYRLTSKFPLLDQQGTITGLVGIGHDITEQIKANQTIHKLSESIEQSPSIVLITNTHGEIEYVNPTFTEITGYTAAEVIGKTPSILKSGETPTEKYNEIWSVIQSGNVWRGEILNRKKDGTKYWEWAIITSLKNERGEIVNYMGIKEDITVRKRMELDLVLAKEKAEENDKLKSAFLANMSHEIRTPLNCILGFSEILADPELEIDQEQRFDYARLISNSGNNLLNIISDIMDISKIEAGQVQVNKTEFSIGQLINDVWSEFNHKAIEKGISFTIDTESLQSAIYINTDETKVKQVLVNFVGNAIKFTDKGTITIGVELEPHSLLIYVKDTGIGIPQSYHQQIFERFRQVEGATTRKYGGNGLGLAISKSLIELLGGTIGMKSEEGEGSMFYFRLPNN